MGCECRCGKQFDSLVEARQHINIPSNHYVVKWDKDVDELVSNEMRDTLKSKNIFCYSKPDNVDCGIFQVCEYAGLEKDGGRCHRCGKNFNLKKQKEAIIMDKEDQIKEIMELIHKIANEKYGTFQRSSRKDSLVTIRNRILEYKDKDCAIEAVLIYLDGFIKGLEH